MKQIVVLAMILFGAYGCTTVPSVDRDSEQGVLSLSFEPDDERGVMYLYRDRESHFGMHFLDIYIGDHTVETSAACFVRIELAPGDYLVEADHPDMFGFEDEMMFEAQPGTVAFFEYKPIARLVVPGSTKIIERSKQATIDKIQEQNLCVSPVKRLGAANPQ
ncbi:hypothetical protein MLC59_01165 [Marinobacter bryozoorum]|uniref:hypothetical protein n=1 Tax=Marinobacter bryozoorum TaxID=256324 RepID=UPI002002F3F6|nr:hypothetical protein [Marinobacter bryozoorum]MCK7542779.1 hypothetical protein [Marinobacter bryozoorum]